MNYLGQIGWRDIIDITLVSLILYRLLLLIRGTKAAKMLIGLLLLLAASVVARQMPLYTTDWLLQSFWAYIVIAVIVLFQPEIRRVLARMGETPFLQRFNPAEEFKSIEETVRAAVSLANRKIGALIAIERDTDLKDFVELGTQLDARLSRDLLLSIFNPTSPIHDGAVVIRGNRVIAAGCFLPIAPAPHLPAARRSQGTRHRAAIGLTEETDAVVIIVSEETGVVSLSVAGKLETDLELGTLRERLTELTTKAAE